MKYLKVIWIMFTFLCVLKNCQNWSFRTLSSKLCPASGASYQQQLRNYHYNSPNKTNIMFFFNKYLKWNELILLCFELLFFWLYFVLLWMNTWMLRPKQWFSIFVIRGPNSSQYSFNKFDISLFGGYNLYMLIDPSFFNCSS